ncbi:YadA-like family protein [Avibacterium paragallinarum]|uniref:YadA-like family protein n=1 Tax=Avibacterium paragallinarum TaxID=728 RepID=UPI002EBEBCF2|nr:YadA-like family protein [Avibacterium paragallinarum]MEE3669517.1 YadA-like family protein [Avibacterium paragallinarum]
MNKVFKIKYSVVKQEMIVVSELANNKDKTASQKNTHNTAFFQPLFTKCTYLALLINIALGASLFPQLANAKWLEVYSSSVKLSTVSAQSNSVNLNPSAAESVGTNSPQGVAIGYGATNDRSATGAIALGFGVKNETLAKDSIAIGYGAKNESTAPSSVTIGKQAINRFEKSIVMGLNAYTQLDPRRTSKETRQGSVVIGENAKSSGNQSVSLGQNSWSKTNSISIGAGTFAEGKSSIAIGTDKISGTKYNDKLPATAWNGTGTVPKNSIWDIFSELYMGKQTNGRDYDTTTRDPNKPEAFYKFSDFKGKYVNTPTASPTYAGKLGAIALGSRTIAAGEMSTAVGSLAFALADRSTAMGLRSFVAKDAVGGTAIGEESRTFAKDSVAIGNKTEASNAGSMAYGYKAKAVGAGAIAIGTEVAAGAKFNSHQTGNLLQDNNAYATLKNADKSDDTKTGNAITVFTQSFDNMLTNGLPLVSENETYLTTSVGAIKKTATTDSSAGGGKNAIAIGSKTFASKANSVALGSYTLADAQNAFALGSYSFVESSATNTITIGVGSYAKGENSFLGGTWASTLSDRTVVLGNSTSISSGSQNALAIGVNVFIGNDSASSLALGMGSTIAKSAKSPDSLAIGKEARIDAKDTDNGTLYQPQVYDETTRAFRNFNESSDYMRQAMALGFNAKVSRGAGKMETGINSMAIGAYAQATLQNSTALGVGSKTDYTWEQLETDPWVSEGAISIPTSGKTGVISVGSKGSERRIVNLASGSSDTDAVNVAQLKTVEERFLSEINLLQNGGGVKYLSVEKTNINGQSGRVASQIRKGESYERYVKLKTQLLYLDARGKLNGEKFDQNSLNKIRAVVQELEAEYSGELKTTASALNQVATQLEKEATTNNFDKFNQYKTQIENASNADSARNVGGLTPQVIAQLKANNNYLNDGAKGQDSIAFGWQAKTSGANNGLAGKQAIAIGFQANSSAENAISIGTNSDTSMTGAVAIGKGATVTAGGKPSIALGQDSTVANSAISRTSSPMINGLIFNNFAGSPETLGVLSIGTAGRERKIVNVAAGDVSQASTEAINGSQLYATNFMLSKVAQSVKSNFGGNVNLGTDGTITFTNIGGTGQDTIHDAINNVLTKLISLSATEEEVVSGEPVYEPLKGAKPTVSAEANKDITGLVDVVKKANSPITVEPSTDNNKKKTFTVGLMKDIEGVNSITFDKSGQDPNQVTGRMSSAGLTFKKGDTTNGSTTTFAEDGLTIDSTTNSAQTNLVKVSRDGFSVKNGSDESKLAPTKLSIGAENAEHVEVTKSGIALKADNTSDKSRITLAQDAITLAGNATGTAIKLTGVADGNITANSKDAVNGGQLRTLLGVDSGAKIGGTEKTTISEAISDVKQALTDATLVYKADNKNGKTVKLTDGLNFTSTTNIGASVEDSGVVKFTLKDRLTGLKTIVTESLNASQNIIAGGTVTVGGETEGIVLTKSGSGNDRTLSLSGAGNAATDGIKVSGVKAGTADTDAVNKGQLDKLFKAINDALGTTDLAVTKNPNQTSIFNPINGTAPTTFKDAVDKLTTAVNTGWGSKVGILATGIDGIDAGNKKISNVADGDISPTSGDVVTGRQLYALMQKGIRVYGDEVSPTKTQTTAPTASSTQGGATTANTAGGVAPAGNVAMGDIAPTQPALPEMKTALVDDHLAVPLGGSLKIHGDHNVKTTISAGNQVGISLQPNISIENNLVIGSNKPEKAKLAAQEGNALVITNKDDGNAAMVFNNEKNMLVFSDKKAKPRAVLDGQNGALTLVGNDDSQVTLSSKKGKDIDGNDLSRLSVTTERTNADGQLEKVETSFATMDDGLKFKADGDKVINKKLNETVEIVGDENVTTSITDDNKVKVSLNKKIAIDEVKIPNTDPDAQKGDSIVINNGGIHAGNKVITGVKASDDPTSAVNRGQLNTVIDNVQNNFNQVNQRIGDLTRESRAGIAGAMATASLQNVVLPGKTTISVGTATFKGENAVAIGMSRLSDNGKVGIRLSGMSTSNGDKGAAMSVGFTF